MINISRNSRMIESEVNESNIKILMEFEKDGYDVAQICQNGHLINRFAFQEPKHNQDYCIDCGAATVIKCERCGWFIRGGNVAALFSYLNYDDFLFPGFCRHCGTPYPWTQAKIQAAKDLAEEIEGLDHSEKELLKKSIDEIVRDTPQTPVAATRFKRLVMKGGKELVSVFKEVLVDVVSETAKKTIWG